MNLMDIMTLSLQFEDAMMSGAPSVTKHASQKPSGQSFGGNQGNSSNEAVPMEIGHMKPQDKSRKDLSKVHSYNCGQIGHYTKDCPKRKKGNLSQLDNMSISLDTIDVTQ